MSTTINSEIPTTKTTDAVTCLTETVKNSVSPTTGAAATSLIVVATDSCSSSKAVDNNTRLLITSSPCNSCSTSPPAAWTDVLCANAYCSSCQQKQKQQPQKQQQLLQEHHEFGIQPETKDDMENFCDINNDALLYKTKTQILTAVQPLTNTTTTTIPLNPSLDDSQNHTMTKQQLLQPFEQQDSSAFDSGRESVNECDSSLDESINYARSSPRLQQPSKKPCTLDFYASSGSQSKWYLPTMDIVKINVQSVDGENIMTKSCVSIAEPESSVVTPPDQLGETQDDGMTSNDKIYTRTATTNDGISVIGIRNGFPTNLSHQIRAVSSPSLTSDTTTTPNTAASTAADNNNIHHHHQRVPSSNSSYTTTTSHEDCQTANNTNITATSNTNTNTTSSSTSSAGAPQNVGVLQKFKRTLTNFNKHQPSATNQTPPPPAPNTSASSTTLALGSNMESPAFQMPADSTTTEMQTDVTDGCNTAVSNKYRFGPLVWRTSKERRKTKYNRRDKCNSGDSGIQIELENDEQFARVLAAGNGGMNAANGSLFNRKQEGMSSLRVRAVRRTNSAKVSTMIDENTSTTTSTSHANKANILKRMDMHNEREAPESLPTRSLSQPNGLESCGMTRNDLDDSDSDSVTSHEEASSYYSTYAEVLYNFTAAGPQELGLEKGTLIEILRKEIGPWWFGRIKKEDASLVEEILDPELGWFPKEFVRVIHSPETDFFYLQHMADHHHHQQQQEPNTTHLSHDFNNDENIVQTGNSLLNTSSSAPCKLVNGNDSSNSMEDNCNTTVIDQHNVTTIVIESSSTPPSSSSTTTTHHFTGLEILNVTNETCSSSSSQAVLSTSQSLNVIMDSADILRRSAVKELLDTEVNYVKLLSAICEGYLPAMSKRIDIFSPNSIRLIFSNITAIYKFQRKFLEALRKGIEQNQVAKVFLKMHKGFLCYSTYCNSYPRALIELASYERVKDARTILDNCRETENLAELPLSAHLLAPVQRICRYPLHLGEMIKSSAKGVEPPAFSLHEYEQIDVSQLDIPDTSETIDMALEAMKSVTEAVNEGKRHSETIARHQASFQNFKGPPLHLHSTRFFVQIDATRQKQNLWNSSCTLFLFDNQLVYCKRDIIKRSNFIYKGRIFLDRCRVVNVRDGKMFGHTIKNSLRIYCEARDKWFDFSFRSANRKHRFLNTLALERQFGGKSLYISEMTGFEYAFEERDYSDQSDYEGGDSGEQKLKEFLYEANLNTGNNTNTSGESSVPESPAKSFKYSDTLPHKKSQRLDTTPTTTSESQTGSLGRRRLGNWFRKPKSTASTPNQSPTHKTTQSAHSTGDLQLTGTDLTETYTVLEHSENGGVSS